MGTIDTVVIGSGVTGLTLATLSARSGSRTVLIDRQLAPGGLINNYRTNEFSFDIGGHVYTTRDPMLNDLLARVDTVAHQRRAFYYDGFQWIPYPVQSHADRLGISIEAGDSTYRGQSLEQWAISTFGLTFYLDWFRPFNQRVWSTDPALMSCDWIANRVQLPTESNGGWGPNADFVYAPGDEIARVLLNQALEAGVIPMFFSRIDHVDLRTHTLIVANNEIQYVRLFDTTGYFTPTLRSNSLLTIGIGLRHLIDYDFHWMYGPLWGRTHRVTLLSRYHPRNAPVGRDSLLIEIPFSDWSQLPQWARTIRKWTLIRPIDAVIELPFTVTTDSVDVAVATISRGYPVPMLNTREFVAMVKQMSAPLDVWMAGRWGSHGYFNLEHCIRDAHVAFDAANSGVSIDYLKSSFYYQ